MTASLLIIVALRSQLLTWPLVHAQILDIVIALAPLDLPCYELLFVVDWLPHWERAHRQYRKVKLIASIVKSIERVRLRRVEPATTSDATQGEK